MQSAVFFPPTLLTGLANGQVYEHVLLELIAGFSTYLLLIRLSINRWASAGAAVAFALNGTAAWFMHPAVNPVAFLPTLLLGIELTYAAVRDGRRGGWWLIAVAGALSIYAGFPEVAYCDGLLVIVWFGWRCSCLERRPLVALVRKSATGAVVGLLLAAPALIPFIGYLDHGYTFLHLGTQLGSHHLVGQSLFSLWLPYVNGPIDGFVGPQLIVARVWADVGGFITTTLLLFALFGVASRTQRRLSLTLAVFLLLVAARIYGFPVLGAVLGVLPGMSNVAFYRYAWPALEMAVVVLAALGLHDLITGPVRLRRVVGVAGCALVLVAAAAIGARTIASPGSGSYFAFTVIWGAGLVVAAAGAATLSSPQVRQRALALVIAVDVVVLFALPELSAPRTVNLDLAPVRFLQQHLGTGRFLSLGPLGPNYGTYFGIASLSANDVPVPQDFADYVRSHLDQATSNPAEFVGIVSLARRPGAPTPQDELLRNLASYRQAGVQYVLTPPGQLIPAGALRLVERTPSASIYQLSGSASYFTTTPACAHTGSGRESVQVSCPSPAVLVRRETYFPGWSASVDGHSVPIHEANGLFQAVTVGAGSHRITFRYWPPGFGWAIGGFVVGCLWLVAAAVVGRRRRFSPGG